MATIRETLAGTEVPDLMRKFRNVAIWWGPMSAAPIEEVTGAAGSILPIPTVYIPVGLIEKSAGVEYPRSVETSEEQSVNHGSATRKDHESDEAMIKYTAQESKRVNLQQAWGVDLTNVEADPTSGEVKVIKPELPDDIQGRLFIMGYDPKWQVGAAKFFPRVEPQEFPSIKWGPTGLTSYETTLQAFFDDELGYAEAEFPLFGPGALELAPAAGFPLATP